MELTPENKATIDGKTYRELLSHWRFAPVGDPLCEEETGKYWLERMSKLRNADPASAIATSKEIGW